MRDINTDYVNNYSTTYADKYNDKYNATDVSQHVLENYDNYHVYVSLHVLCSISLCLSLSLPLSFGLSLSVYALSVSTLRALRILKKLKHVKF